LTGFVDRLPRLDEVDAAVDGRLLDAGVAVDRSRRPDREQVIVGREEGCVTFPTRGDFGSLVSASRAGASNAVTKVVIRSRPRGVKGMRL